VATDSPTGLVAVPHSLVLRAWEAVSTERSLQRVLDAVADVLLPVVPFNGVALVSLASGDDHLLAAHIAGYAHREGETALEYLSRPELRRTVDVVPKPLVPYDEAVVKRARAGEPYMCADLLAKDAWYEHEFQIASAGVRAYASVPLLVRETLLGTAAFSRIDPIPFTATELAILKAVARALAVAVSNALAYDDVRRLRDQVNAENLELRAQLGQSPWFEDIVGDSTPMRRVLERVEQVATTDATVLITGETGTGKELVARAIHQRSPRAREPFIKVNCAAIPETLLASELFGHERGAFTGAVERRRGRFELADRGTIFLDEIGELAPDTQVTLLRVLQEREFERLGGSRTVKVDVRIVAATNRDIASDVAEGRFRSDLYYRLNVFPVHVPALREHPEDIVPLVAHFAAKYAARFRRPVTRVSPQAMRELMAHDWPGNVRELEHVIERAVIVSTGPTLQLERDRPAASRGVSPLVDQVTASERAAIEAALASSRGRVSGPSGAARRLDMPASTLEFRIRKLGIDKFRFRRTTEWGQSPNG
jgi:formate hydrogenlyase transcriptional activator